MEQVHESGCFYCASSRLPFSEERMTDVEKHQCVDVCEDNDLSYPEWDAGFSGGFFDRTYFDRGCSHALFEALEGTAMSPDTLELVENLVFDDRTGICYNFDPRDEKKRRLNPIIE